MNKVPTVTLAALLLALPFALRAADALPPFSWDHVPVYAHVGKTSDDFTPAQLDFLAKHFNFITIEKHQASHKHGSTEEGFAVAAREIKQRNPRAKVLFYWNASLDTSSNRGGYNAMRTFPAGGFLKDSQGEPVMRRKTVPNYDLTQPDVRDWWSDAAAKAVREYGADGIFADAMGQREDKGIDDKRFAALVAGRVALLAETRRKIGPDKLIIYNGLMKDDPKKLLRFADGAMIESFVHPNYGDSKELVATFFEATRAAARDGKIVVLKGWPRFTFRQPEMMQKPHAELARLARERITFPLACFLVAAEPNCCFCCTWGYREMHGTFDWYPEFDKPLGPPKGEAKRTGWIYQREFAHALQWCLTGKEAHAQKAMAILNAWSTTLKTVSGHDTKLLIGMEGVKLCNAAELMRHTCAGWRAEDQKRFEHLLRQVFYPPIKDFFPRANGNGDASMIQTMPAMGIYLDDRAMFDRAVDYYLKGEGNGAIRNYVNALGECQESGRDQAHTRMGRGFLGCACEMAWKQGVDLYGASSNRLAVGFEYTAKYNLGHDVPYEPYRSFEGAYFNRSISPKARGRFAPIYERIVYHYHGRKGLEMPYSRQVVAKGGIEGRGGAHVPWGTLMFAKSP